MLLALFLLLLSSSHFLLLLSYCLISAFSSNGPAPLSEAFDRTTVLRLECSCDFVFVTRTRETP